MRLVEYAKSDGGNVSSLQAELYEFLTPVACQINKRRPITNHTHPSEDIEALHTTLPAHMLKTKI